MPLTVTCPGCHRLERWSSTAATPYTREIVLEGGARRPREHPALAAWRVFHAARLGGPAVVGTCDACGQPLTCADPDAEPVSSYVLPTPAGDLIVGETIEGPQGILEPSAVEPWLLAQLPPPPRNSPGAVMMAGVALLLFCTLGLLWIGTFTFFVWFVWNAS